LFGCSEVVSRALLAGGFITRRVMPTIMNDEITAYHEAGHVYLALHVGARVLSVTIQPDNDDQAERYGDTQVAWPSQPLSSRERREQGTLVALAGPVAEMIYRQEPFHPGMVAEWQADWQTAWQEAAELVPNERKRIGYLEAATQQLRLMLNEDHHWAAVATIADHLAAHLTLDEEMIAQIELAG
jgi:hypothetical protein